MATPAAPESPMNNWRSWSLEAWNERLLNYFFRKRTEHDTPVVVVLVTAEELARATGDVNADAENVRNAFVDAVRSSIRPSKNLLEEAADYDRWPEPPRSDLAPPFVAHLLFACIAASESSDDLGDEGSFITRLRDLTANRLPEHSLAILPRLWEHMTVWLNANDDRFRQLYLPDPGGLTRIGYTVKLAFPDRRDQRQLSDLLASAGLAGHDPPVARVLSLVASERARFRPSFLRAYDDFRVAFTALGSAPISRLADHRFWAAVRDAALRGRGHLEVNGESSEVSLLAEVDDDRLAIFVVTDRPFEDVAVTFAQLPVSYGQWQFALIPKDQGILTADNLDRVVHGVLAGSLHLPKLASYVQQGLLPFVASPHGLLELADRDQLDDTCIALVRADMTTDFLRVACGATSTLQPSSYDGWDQVCDPQLRTLPPHALDGTSLTRTWMLQACMSWYQSRLVGGVRADDGWLGVREVLPRIVAPGASEVFVAGMHGRVALQKTTEDVWVFPHKDIFGECVLVTVRDGKEHRRTLRFHASPANEGFRQPSDYDAYHLEEISGTGTLSGSLPYVQEESAGRWPSLCERVVLLGRDVGVFVDNVDNAAWKITQIAGTRFGARANLRGEAASPLRQAASMSARRRWRKLLFECAQDAMDPEFEKGRRKIKANASGHARLPQIDTGPSQPDFPRPHLVAASDAAGRLVRVVAGRAAARVGIDWSEWSKLAQSVLGIDASLLRSVTRAWMEAGLIDVVSFARWRHRLVFAHSPHLVAFRVGERYAAALTGLAIPTTADQVRIVARMRGMLVEERFSLSCFVPESILLWSPQPQGLHEVASACQLSLRWLDARLLMEPTTSRYDGRSPPPGNYERATRWLRWSLQPGEHGDVTVEHHVRRDRPDYWVASQAGQRVWFYDLNLTRAWAAALIGQDIITVASDGMLEAHHAFLPLPLARAVAILGTGLPGPVSGAYRYPVGSSTLVDCVLNVLRQTFDCARLSDANPTKEKMTDV